MDSISRHPGLSRSLNKKLGSSTICERYIRDGTLTRAGSLMNSKVHRGFFGNIFCRKTLSSELLSNLSLAQLQIRIRSDILTFFPSVASHYVTIEVTQLVMLLVEILLSFVVASRLCLISSGLGVQVRLNVGSSDVRLWKEQPARHLQVQWSIGTKQDVEHRYFKRPA